MPHPAAREYRGIATPVRYALWDAMETAKRNPDSQFRYQRAAVESLRQRGESTDELLLVDLACMFHVVFSFFHCVFLQMYWQDATQAMPGQDGGAFHPRMNRRQTRCLPGRPVHNTGAIRANSQRLFSRHCIRVGPGFGPQVHGVSFFFPFLSLALTESASLEGEETETFPEEAFHRAMHPSSGIVWFFLCLLRFPAAEGNTLQESISFEDEMEREAFQLPPNHAAGVI